MCDAVGREVLPGVGEKLENDRKPVVNSIEGSVISLHGDNLEGGRERKPPWESIGKKEANKGFIKCTEKFFIGAPGSRGNRAKGTKSIVKLLP